MTDVLVAALVRYGFRARVINGVIWVGRAAVTHAEAVAMLDDWHPDWRSVAGV